MRPKASTIFLPGLALLLWVFPSYAQVGGEGTYGFLELVTSPRVAAMGGRLNSVADEDVSLALYNPALLNEQMDKSISLSYADYLSDVRFGYVAYGRSLKTKGNVALGVQYINYGRFIAADESGTITGSFDAAEYALVFGYDRSFVLWGQTIQVGVNVKPIFSQLERYESLGIAADAGCAWSLPEKNITTALVVRHLGTQITSYTDRRESLPTEVELGFSKRFTKAPFRVSLVAHHLETPRLGKKDRVFNDDTGMWEAKNEPAWKTVGKETFRHLVAGTEFFPFKGFVLRAGYNFNRREELRLDTSKKTVGLSWGFGIRFSYFDIDFARAKYHLAGSSNLLSVRTRFGADRHKKP